MKTFRVLIKESRRPWYSVASSLVREVYTHVDDLPKDVPMIEYIRNDRGYWLWTGRGPHVQLFDLIEVAVAKAKLAPGEHTIEIDV